MFNKFILNVIKYHNRLELQWGILNSKLKKFFPFTWLRPLFSLLLKKDYIQQSNYVIKTPFGYKLHGKYTSCSLNASLFWTGTFEPSLVEFISRVVKPGDICVDLGANVGYYTLFMSKLSGKTGKVYAVEASPANHDAIIKNLYLNNISNVICSQCACSKIEKEIDFYIHPKNDMLCRSQIPSIDSRDAFANFDFDGKTKIEWKKISVRSKTLESIIGKDLASVSFIKVDVEGMEHELYETLAHSLDPKKVSIAIEISLPFNKECLTFLNWAKENFFYAYDLHIEYNWFWVPYFSLPEPISIDDFIMRYSDPKNAAVQHRPAVDLGLSPVKLFDTQSNKYTKKKLRWNKLHY